MSVTSQVPFKSYTAAPGATVFPSEFRVILATDLVVSVNGVVVTSGFTIAGLGATAGVDVTFTAPMVGGEIVELQREVPLVRATDYQQNGDFPAPVVNNDFDRLWMALQDQQFLSALAILLPLGDAASPMTIPSVAERANKFLGFDAAGNALAAASTAVVGDGSVTTVKLANGALSADATGRAKMADRFVNFTKMVAVNTARLLGRSSAGSGDIEEITIGSGLTLTGGVLAASGGGVPDASETVKGIVELATNAETTTGTDTARAVHPAGAKAAIDARLSSTTPSSTGTAAIGTSTNFARADHSHAQGAPTAAQVGTGNAGLAYGAVGTYLWADSGGAVTAGSTAAGSSLNPVQSGTWRLMQGSISGVVLALWLRIS